MTKQEFVDIKIGTYIHDKAGSIYKADSQMCNGFKVEQLTIKNSVIITSLDRDMQSLVGIKNISLFTILGDKSPLKAKFNFLQIQHQNLAQFVHERLR